MRPLELAIYYSQTLDLTLLPVHAQTKTPLALNWTNDPKAIYSEDKIRKHRLDPALLGEPIPFGSSKDAGTIRAWFERWPMALVGIRTGAINGVVCLDVDRHGASDGFKTLKTLDGVKPAETATVLTPGNGWHLWYRFPADLASGTMLGAGLDFQARGRMVIAPGCIRAGKEYSYINGHTLADLAPLPGSVLAKLKRSPGQQRLDDWSTRIEATAEGERHSKVRDACWSLAHDVVGGKLDEAEFRSRIADMASTCRPPMDRLDVENSIESALRKVRAESGRKDKPDAKPAFTLPDFEPADEPVELAAILSDVASVLVDYVAMDAHQGNACALWILHCHCLAATDYTPRLLITSPTRRCGKSTLLRVIAKLVPRPLFLSGVSAAMLFRSIGEYRPVLLVDEADNAGLKHNEDLRIVFNEGTFAEAMIGRTVGDSHEPKMFPIFAPAVLAGIGSMPSTLMDRSIIVRMRRKLKSETKTRFDRRNAGHLGELGRQAARFAIENVEALAAADPKVPSDLNDRELDGWRPLLAIADMAGGEWAKAARDAAVALSEGDDDHDDEPALMLLGDCHKVFERLKRQLEDEIASADLVTQLQALEDRPWTEWGRFKKPITSNGVARLLKRYQIKPGLIGPKDSRSRGYAWAQFDDAWQRYGSGA